MSLWADSGREGRLAPALRGPAHLDAVGRLKDWTRARFQLCEEDTVLVSEGLPTFPGCPPIETLVAFWGADGVAHHFKVFKRAEDVVEDDLPPPWMREALRGIPGMSCSCC